LGREELPSAASTNIHTSIAAPPQIEFAVGNQCTRVGLTLDDRHIALKR
jgi:hypothetical protein